MNKYSCNTSMLDILFNMLLAFVMLFIIAFTLVRQDNPDSKKADIRIEGDLLITITWPSERDDDIDIWVRDPKGNIVFFSERQAGLMYLDRDDVGFTNDVILINGENIKSIGNQEMVTIRGLEPGEFIFNIHAYQLRGNSPVPISIRIDRIGSPTKTIFVRTVTLEKTSEEKTIVRLTFDKKGNVIESNHLFISLFNQRNPENYPENSIEYNPIPSRGELEE